MAHSPVTNLASSVVKRHWSSFAIELVLIVAGILIALSIDNWVTENENRQKEESYLRALLVDLDTIEAEIDSKLEYETAFVDSANAAMRMIQNRNESFDADEFGVLISISTMRRSTRLDSPAFFDIVNSGGLALIRDDEIKSGILTYFAAAERAELVLEKNSYDFVDNGIVPFARSLGFGIGESGSIQDDAVVVSEYVEQQKVFVRRVVESLDDRDWQDIEAQLHWRAVIAHEDTFTIEEIKADTQAMRRAIESYLSD